jgi:hypothetical protein
MSANSMDTSGDSPTSKKINLTPITNASQSQIAQKTWEISNSIQGCLLKTILEQTYFHLFMFNFVKKLILLKRYINSTK